MMAPHLAPQRVRAATEKKRSLAFMGEPESAYSKRQRSVPEPYHSA